MISKIQSPFFTTKENNRIVYPFGPPIYQTMVESSFTKLLLDEGRKLNVENDDFSFRLAGNFKYGRSYVYKKEFILENERYLLSKVEDFLNGIIDQHNTDYPVNKLLNKNVDRDNSINGKLILDNLWINFSKKHDFNPTHHHTGVLSFVIYCKVPEKIFEIQADSNHQNAGNIVFGYGEMMSALMITEYALKPVENLMLIFPSKLNHYVPPYWVDEERISVSGNFCVI